MSALRLCHHFVVDFSIAAPIFPKPFLPTASRIRGVAFGLPSLPLTGALLFSGKQVIGLSYSAFFILSSEWTAAN